MANDRGVVTFFSRLTDLQDVNYMSIQTFTNASTLLSDFFNLWGSRMALVKSDVEGNIRKVTNAVCSLNCTTLPEMLAKEQSLDLYKKDSSGSVGLLWLKRSFQFLVSLLWFLSISTDDDCMKSIVSQAYDESLRHYHNRFMRQTFRLVMHALPKRSSLVQKLALDQENCEKQVLTDAGKCRTMLLPFVARLEELLIAYKLEHPV
ncbi:Glycolipid transfer protein HET C2 [Fasciolopsis buskii]|uniref:Glycolipid transfer protein HET C2 n=1 Tax=Fasciolopsis buskii TaxID=27845 RepID=A0A8E0VQX7_9TREM|nr:Glycolipid transfer protein HET C2 [Fasciolopsis buski]